MFTLVLPHCSLNNTTSPSLQKLLYRARFQAALCAPSELYQHYLAWQFKPNTILAVPIYQQMGMNTTQLVDARCFELNEQEATQYINALNQFYGDDAHFQLITPKIWQLTLPEMNDFNMPSVLDIGGQTDAMYRSEQQASAKWLQFSTELQMWLHQSPLNQQRQQHQQTIINGLWIWLPENSNITFQAACLVSDSEWAKFSPIKQTINFPKDFHVLQQQCQQNHIDVQQITLFSEDFVAGALTQNSWATEEKWQYWEQHFFAPILKDLDKIQSFQIVTEQGVWQINAKKWYLAIKKLFFKHSGSKQ